MKQNREKGIIATSIIGIAGNILLVGLKAFIGFLANSISIITDAINNLSDALSSLITIIGTKLSNKKPDKQHPYGHGRIEYLTATLIGALILFAGGTAISESIKSIIDYFKNGATADYDVTSFIIISLAIAIKLLLGIFFKLRGKKFKSDVLNASGMDALFDVLLSAATLVGAIISKTTGFYCEGYIGIAIGLFIIKSGIGVIKESVSHMIGSRADEELKKQIKQEVYSVSGVQGVYDLILNNYGNDKYIGSVHVGVDNKLNAQDIQKIEREISAKMYLEHGIIMTVGIYTENDDSELSIEIKKNIQKIIKNNKNILQLHGFYFDESTKICNFDLVISFDEKEPQTVIDSIGEELQKIFPDVVFMINLDLDY